MKIILHHDDGRRYAIEQSAVSLVEETGDKGCDVYVTGDPTAARVRESFEEVCELAWPAEPATLGERLAAAREVAQAPPPPLTS